jgi:hypothetical protein
MFRVGGARAIRWLMERGTACGGRRGLANGFVRWRPAIFFAVSLLGCGGVAGPASPPPPPQGITVSLTPLSVSRTRAFRAEGIRQMPMQQFHERVAPQSRAGEITMKIYPCPSGPSRGFCRHRVDVLASGHRGFGVSVCTRFRRRDMRQPPGRSGRTACPQLTRFDISAPGAIHRQ